jgi:holo-[acyl-carrier protein] synthase
VDIVEIDRIRRAVETHGQRFLTRVFSPEEVSLCMGRAGSAACLAARFAAKEAFKKAIGASIPVPWRHVTVVSGDGGGPRLKLLNKLGDRLGGSFAVSLSHSRDYAVAVVMWERI